MSVDPNARSRADAHRRRCAEPAIDEIESGPRDVEALS